jgi:hypothetical protein
LQVCWPWRARSSFEAFQLLQAITRAETAGEFRTHRDAALYHSRMAHLQWNVPGKSSLTDQLPAIWSIPSRCTVQVRQPSFEESLMRDANSPSDRELSKTVNKRLIRAGGGSVTATTQMGVVTLTGMLRYEAQRRPIVKAVTAVAGVARVVDQLKLLKR